MALHHNENHHHQQHQQITLSKENQQMTCTAVEVRDPFQEMFAGKIGTAMHSAVLKYQGVKYAKVIIVYTGQLSKV